MIDEDKMEWNIVEQTWISEVLREWDKFQTLDDTTICYKQSNPQLQTSLR